MVQIGDKIKSKYGIGQVKSLMKNKDNRYIIIAEYPIKLSIIEGDDNFEVITNG